MDERLAKYLREMGRRLRDMPAREKADILGELRSGIADMAAAGDTPEEILRKLGPSAELAAGYPGGAAARGGKPSRPRLRRALGFCARACAAWLVAIPVLASLALAFCVSAPASAAAGLLGCARAFVRLPFARGVRVAVFGWEPTGVAALLVGLALAAAFWLLGAFFWRLTVATVRRLGEGWRALRRADLP